ncbi:MAG: hypothetical protein C0423_19805 [Methylibium sp.]|nr:hypothetical protein [Methylibium sp.]
MKLEHNAHQVAQRYRNAAQAVRTELGRELVSLAELVAARMRVAAPKFRSTTANSVRVTAEGSLRYFVGPHTDYALWLERGRKPGKGLPRFFDPAAAGAVAWLEAQPVVVGPNGPLRPGSGRRARRGSARRQREELALRDRYMAWSRHVKAQGIRPHPFVKPTADAMSGQVHQLLLAAVRRGVQAFNSSRSSAL